MLKYTRNSSFFIIILMSVFVLTSASQAVTPPAADLNLTQAKLKNTMNFDECMEYSVKPCVRLCPGFLGPKPTIGIQPEYTEPTALIETSCLRGETQLAKSGGLNFINSMLAGSMMDNPSEQKCADGIRSPGTKITRHYNEARVYGFAAPTRYLSSGDPLDVTKSLTCGIAGSAGLFMNFSNMFQGFKNFSIGNLAKQISQLPQQALERLQESIQQITEIPQQVAGMIQDIPNMVTDTIGEIQSAANGIVNGLEGSLDNFGNLGSSLGDMAGVLQEIPGGDVLAGAVAPVSSALQQLGSIQNLDMSTLADLQNLDMSQLTQYAADLGGQFLNIPGASAEILAMGNSLQQLGSITTSTWQTAVSNVAETAGGGIAYRNLTPSVDQQLAQDTGRNSGNSDLWRQVKMVQNNNSAFVTEPVLSSFAPIGDVPEVTSVNNKMMPTGRLLNSGGTQLAAEMLEREFKQQNDFINFYGAESRRLTTLALEQRPEGADVCELRKNIYKGEAEIMARLQEITVDGLEIYPEGTYLPVEFAQRSAGGEEASCIKTHAGYQLRPSLGVGLGTVRINNINCIRACGGGDKDEDCEWVVKEDFKGSCKGNRLSQFVVDGKHPACADDRQELNDAREQTVRQNLAETQAKLKQSAQQLDTYLRQNNVSCDVTLGHIKPKEKGEMLLASAPLVGVGLSEQQITEAEQTVAVGGLTQAQKSSFQLETAGFTGLTANLNSVSAFTRKGGLQQAMNNMIGKRLPFGLYPAFISEATEWSKPPQFDLVGQIKMAVGSVTQAAIAPFMCLAPAHAADYGIINTGALSKMNKLANCVGTWGAEHPSTGWSYHKDPTKSAALAGYRGHSEALKFGAIQANTKGTQNFNLDYPFVKDGGKHRGSGCYNVGTGKNLQGSDLLNPDFGNAGTGAMDIKDGKHMFTMWKNTSCCIWFCKGVRVDRRY